MRWIPRVGEFAPTSKWRKPALSLAVLSFLSWAFEQAPEPTWQLLGTVCLLGTAISVYWVAVALRDGPSRALTDPFIVLLAASCMYYCVGPLMYVFGEPSSIDHAQGFFKIEPEDALRVTTMNLCGMSIMLLAGSFLDTSKAQVLAPGMRRLGRIPGTWFFWSFLAAGLTCKFYVYLVDTASEREVISGVYRALSNLTFAAAFVGLLQARTSRPLINATSLIAAGLDSAMGVLLFNKSQIVLPWLVVSFALYVRRPHYRRIVASVCLALISVAILSRPVSEARNALTRSAETTTGARLAIISDVADHTSEAISGIFGRICYTNPQVAAVSLYDAGDGGDDVELLLWVFLPRALFEEKPVITRAGSDFNKKILGKDTSSTGMGLFVNGYYNMGWLGLVAVSILSAWILGLFSAISRLVVEADALAAIPVVLLGMYCGFRVDGNFISDYLGTFAMILCPFLLMILVLRHGSIEALAERRSSSAVHQP
jgi:hypothetical protein